MATHQFWDGGMNGHGSERGLQGAIQESGSTHMYMYMHTHTHKCMQQHYTNESCLSMLCAILTTRGVVPEQLSRVS